eukprot:scaffold55810_cov60-Phaeocystis_antarctica.AAC.2
MIVNRATSPNSYVSPKHTPLALSSGRAPSVVSQAAPSDGWCGRSGAATLSLAWGAKAASICARGAI